MDIKHVKLNELHTRKIKNRNT